MLPGFIIDQIRQREEEERAKRHVQIELPLPAPEGSRPPEREEEVERGVVIIDLRGD